MIAYAEAVHIQKFPKGKAYKAYVNDKVKDVFNAIGRLERNEEYKAIVTTILEDSNFQLDKKIANVRSKYVSLIESNIDTMQNVIKKASEEGQLKDQAMAVRLANETITAMSIIDGSREPSKPTQGTINKSSVISWCVSSRGITAP